MNTAEHHFHLDDHVDKVDRYLRRDDTKLATIIKKLCPHKGEKYINSPWKRSFDLTLGVPSSIIATPVILTLATAKLIEDGHSPFFVHMRASKMGDNSENDLPVLKIRSMKPNSDMGSKANTEISRGLKPEEDPRSTPLGKIMRKHYLDELPQLYQVVLGQMTLFSSRATGKEYVAEEHSWTQKRYERWSQAYNSNKPGLSGIYQSIGSPLKWDQDNYHLDMFYYNNATLGMDLYLIWRTAARLARIK